MSVARSAKLPWVLGAVLLGKGAAMAADAPVVDQYTLISNGYYAAAALLPVGQSFTAGRTGTLAGIEVAAFRAGDWALEGDVRFEVFDAEGASLGRVSRPLAGFPDGHALVPEPLVLDALGAGYFDLSALGIAVHPGRVLRFELTPPGGGVCDLERFTCVDGRPSSFCFFDGDCDPQMGLGSAFHSYFPGGAYQGGTPTSDDIVFKTLVDVCGNDILEPGEQCDDGGRVDGDCCDSSCDFEPATTLCREPAFECDVAEFCTGASGLCPEDALAEAGTACSDDGSPCTTDLCDEAGACAHMAGNAGVTCRVSAGACDVEEHCDGSQPACPADAQAPDSDDDAACDPVDPCTNLFGGRDFVERPRAKLEVRTPPAAGKPTTIRARADFVLPLGVRFADLRPDADGARLLLGSASGGVLLDAAAPAGRRTRRPPIGWKPSASGRSWTYRGPAGTPPDAVESLKIAARGGAESRQVSVTALLRSGRIEVPAGDLPIGLTVVLGGAEASAEGRCGESRFRAGDCVVTNRGTGVRCAS